jgi:hypothetical protein
MISGSNVSTGTTEYLYNLSGQMITSLSYTGSWSTGEVFVGNRHLASYSNGTTYFNHVDWLGTERVHTDPTGATAETCTSLAFGDAKTCSGVATTYPCPTLAR